MHRLSSSAILAPMQGAPRGKWEFAGVFALALLPLAAPAMAQTAPRGASPKVSLPVATTTLSNGLRLVVSEDHARPLVAVTTCYGVGASDDPPGKVGLAALVAELLGTPATRHLEPSSRYPLAFMLKINLVSRELSANSNATCGAILTQRAALPYVLWLEADRLGFAADGVTSDAIASSLQQIRVRRDQSPIGTLHEAIRRAMFGEVELRHDDTSGLDALTTAEVRARLASHYGASRAMIVIAGDVDPDAAKAEVERAFGRLPKSLAAGAVPSTAPVKRSDQRVAVRTSTGVPSVIVAYGPTANLFDEDDARLDAIAGILGTRLWERLVKSEAVATWTSARQWSRRTRSYFTIQADLVSAKAREDVVRAITEEVERLASEGPSAAEVEMQRLKWSTQALVRLDDLMARSAQIASALESGRAPAEVFAKPLSYEQLDAPSIQAAAKRQLDASHRVVAILEQDNASVGGDVSLGVTP